MRDSLLRIEADHLIFLFIFHIYIGNSIVLVVGIKHDPFQIFIVKAFDLLLSWEIVLLVRLRN